MLNSRSLVVLSAALSKLCLMLWPNPTQNRLTTQPARSTLSVSLAPGFHEDYWPSSPKLPATWCPLQQFNQTPKTRKYPLIRKYSPPLKIMLPPQIFIILSHKPLPSHIPLIHHLLLHLMPPTLSLHLLPYPSIYYLIPPLNASFLTCIRKVL